MGIGEVSALDLFFFPMAGKRQDMTVVVSTTFLPCFLHQIIITSMSTENHTTAE